MVALKNIFQSVGPIVGAIAAIGFFVFVRWADKRILRSTPKSKGIFRLGRSRGFPLIPLNDAQIEKRRPVLWLWHLVSVLVVVVMLIWYLSRK